MARGKNGRRRRLKSHALRRGPSAPTLEPLRDVRGAASGGGLLERFPAFSRPGSGLVVLPTVWQLVNTSGSEQFPDQIPWLALLVLAFFVFQHGEGLRVLQTTANDFARVGDNKTTHSGGMEVTRDSFLSLLRGMAGHSA